MKTKKDRGRAEALLALGLAGLLLAPQGALAGETRTFTGDFAQLATISTSFGDYKYTFAPADLANVTDNTITVNYLSGYVPLRVYGAYDRYADVGNNTVMLSQGSVGSHSFGGEVCGGWSGDGNSTGNSVTISVLVRGEVYGGCSYFAGNATNNSVTLNSGPVVGNVYGGIANNGNAAGNRVTLSGGGVAESLYGGTSRDNATNNAVDISGGKVFGNVYGGFANNGTATGNRVTLSGGEADNEVYGGMSWGGSATGNHVTISGGRVSAAVYGGRADNGSATYNTITISGSPTLADSVLHGGYSFFGGDARTGNTLNVRNSGMSAKGIKNFQRYNFYLPPSLAKGGTMFSVSDPADITNAIIGVGIDGSATALQLGDRVTLLHSTGGLTATGINRRAVGLVGIARIYEFDLTTNDNNLYATAASPARQNPQVKALSEGQASSAAFLGQGADLLSGQGLQNARSAASGTGGQPAGFAALGGHSLRYETGSHVSVNGFSLLIGAAKAQEAATGASLGAMFLEAGRGNYSTFNQFADRTAVRGDGDTRYFGIGWLGRSYKQEGQYLEGSLRAGRVSNKFHSGDFGADAVEYDIHAPYYGLHIGLGREKAMDDKSGLDIYTRMLCTRQNGSSATIAGDQFAFAGVDSLRWQVGAKLSRKVDDQTTVRAGLAYQYEFDGKADATVNGSAIEAPSLRGGTGITEVGMTQESKDGKGASLDFSLQGLFGKARGFTGNLRASWKF